MNDNLIQELTSEADVRYFGRTFTHKLAVKVFVVYPTRSPHASLGELARAFGISKAAVCKLAQQARLAYRIPRCH